MAKSLAETVLTPPGQQVKVLRVSPVSTPATVRATQPLQTPVLLAVSWQHTSLLDQLLFGPQRRAEDRNYLEFEFAAKSNTYIRVALAVVTVANGDPI